VAAPHSAAIIACGKGLAADKRGGIPRSIHRIFGRLFRLAGGRRILTEPMRATRKTKNSI
jgi:hypothetical protein